MSAAPTGTAWDVREDLSLSISEFDHEMNERGYVGHRLFTPTPRDSKSGKFRRVPLEQELQDDDCKRNPDSTFKRTTMEWGSDQYDTQSYGTEATIDDEMQARYDDLFDAEEQEFNRISRKLQRAFEVEVATEATTIANYDVSRVKGGLGAWTLANKENATPYADIDEQREQFFLDFGAEPNALFLPRSDMRAALASDEIVDRLKGQNYIDARPGVLNRNATNLATALDIPEVIPANALRNVGSSRNLSRIWPSGRAVLARISTTSDPSELSYGRAMIFSPMGVADGDRMGVWTESYDEPQRAGSVLRVRANWQLMKMHVQAARLLLTDGTAQPT